MSCARELFNVRTPHRISADVNISTSAHTGFADTHAAIFGGFAVLNKAKKMDLRTLIQRKFGFADINTAGGGIADLHTAIVFGFADLDAAKIWIFLNVRHTGFLRTLIIQRPHTPDLRTLII